MRSRGLNVKIKWTVVIRIPLSKYYLIRCSTKYMIVQIGLPQINTAVKKKKRFVHIVIVGRREKHIKKILLKGFRHDYLQMRACTTTKI